MRSKWKSLALVLSAVPALLAFFVVSAQAENLKDGGKAGVFRIAGSGSLVKGGRFILSQEGTGQLLIEGKNAYIGCGAGKGSEGEGISETELTLTILFEKCATFEDTTKKELSACKIKGGTFSGRFKTKPKLHEGNLYILFSGSSKEEEELIATVEFEGEECSLGFKPKIKGSLVGKVDNGNEAVKHLIEFSRAIQELFQINNGTTIEGDKVKFASAQVFFANSWVMELTGVHIGKTWSVL